MNNRLIHDAALVMAKAILEVMGLCLREEEQRDAFDEFYAICKAGIEAYLIQSNRMVMRLSPTNN